MSVLLSTSVKTPGSPRPRVSRFVSVTTTHHLKYRDFYISKLYGFEFKQKVDFQKNSHLWFQMVKKHSENFLIRSISINY